MNINEVWEDFTSTEKELFQNCCRKLLNRTFLVRDKRDDRKQFFFVSNHIDAFSNSFSFMGFDVVCERDQGIVMLVNALPGERSRLYSNRHRFTKEETIFLCCLWLLYVSRMKESSLASIVTVQVQDIRYELEKHNARDLIPKSGFENLFKVFKKYSLLEVEGKLGDMDCKVHLYPSVQFALDIKEFGQFVKDMENTVLKHSEEIEEVEDDQSEDVESE